MHEIFWFKELARYSNIHTIVHNIFDINTLGFHVDDDLIVLTSVLDISKMNSFGGVTLMIQSIWMNCVDNNNYNDLVIIYKEAYPEYFNYLIKKNTITMNDIADLFKPEDTSMKMYLTINLFRGLGKFDDSVELEPTQEDKLNILFTKNKEILDVLRLGINQDENIANILLMFSLYLSTYENIHDLINETYKEKEIEYLNSYINSMLYKTDAIKSFSYTSQIYSEKILGILIHNLEEGCTHDIEKITKKAIRKIYNNLKNKSSISNKDILNMSDSGNNVKDFYISMFLFAFEGKYNVKSLTGILKQFYPEISSLIRASEYVESFDAYIKDIKQNLNDSIKYIKKSLGIKNNTYLYRDLYCLFQGLSPSIEKKVNFHAITYEMNGLNMSSMISNYYLTSKELDQIIIYWLSGEADSYYISNHKELRDKVFDLSKDIQLDGINEDMVVRLYYYIQNFFIFKEYNSLKSEYIQFINEDYLLEKTQYIHRIKLQHEKLVKIELDFNSKQKLLDIKEKELLDELKSLNKEKERLLKENQNLQGLKLEVNKLRECVFKKNQYECISEDDDIDISLINNKKIVIIGGNINWIKKMKEKLYECIFICDDNKNNDLKFIKNSETVLINTNISHSLYYKIMNILNKSEVQYHYLDDTSNIDKSLKLVYDIIANDK